MAVFNQVGALKPLHAELIPPLGDDGVPSVIVRHTPDGRPVYRRKLIRGQKVPKIDKETGEQEWKLHPTTAKPWYRMWRQEVKEREQLFTMESDGHANVYVQEYHEPTPEEVKANEQAAAVQKFKDDLAVMATQKGISAEAFLARLMGHAEEAQNKPEAKPEKTFPHNYAPGRWELSDGAKMQGSREEAVAAEAALLKADEEPAY